MLDSGQYDPRWPFIHMNPEEAIKAAVDLKAKAMMPMHVGRFSLANHAWNEPFNWVVKASEKVQLPIFTPKIGQPIWIDGQKNEFSKWWKY